MLDSQGSRPDFRCGQGVKHENLLGQDLDRGRGWKYRRLCSVPPLVISMCIITDHGYNNAIHVSEMPIGLDLRASNT